MFYFSSTLSSTSCLSSGESEESTLGKYNEVSAWRSYNPVEIDYFVDILLPPMEKVLWSMNESNLSKNEGFERVTDKSPSGEFAFFQNADLIRWIEQNKIFEKIDRFGQGLNPGYLFSNQGL